MNSERTPWKPGRIFIIGDMLKAYEHTTPPMRFVVMRCAAHASRQADGIIKQMIFVARNEWGTP